MPRFPFVFVRDSFSIPGLKIGINFTLYQCGIGPQGFDVGEPHGLIVIIIGGGGSVAKNYQSGFSLEEIVKKNDIFS
jgi:hypothetical protein